MEKERGGKGESWKEGGERERERDRDREREREVERGRESQALNIHFLPCSHSLDGYLF